jgi:hypothetical protein
MAGAEPGSPLPVGVTIEGSATVILHSDRPQVLLEVGRRPRKRKNRTRDNDDEVAVTLDISGADGLVNSWRQVATQAGEPEHRPAAVAALAPPTLTPKLLRPAGPAGWWLAITRTQVNALAEEGPLTQPIGLETRDKHTCVVSAIRFTPGDRTAEQAFDLDALIQQLLAHPDTAAQLVATEKGAGQRAGGPPAVRCRNETSVALNRAWSLAVLGDYHTAAQSFQNAMADLPGERRSDRGVYLARAALVHAGDHEVEHAATLGLEALTIGIDTGSGRILTELSQLDDVLAPWNTLPTVADFRTAMKDTISRQA